MKTEALNENYAEYKYKKRTKTCYEFVTNQSQDKKKNEQEVKKSGREQKTSTSKTICNYI